MDNNFIKLSRECDGVLIPSGEAVKLKKGTPVKITQSLGGYFTLYVNGNLVKLNGEFADAIGKKVEAAIPTNTSKKFDEDLIWEQLKTCYDPEIPVNIVDLGLIYDVEIDGTDVDVKMTLTAAGCGMGPYIAQQAEWAISELDDVEDVNVDIVFDPPWDPERITEDGKKLLGID